MKFEVKNLFSSPGPVHDSRFLDKTVQSHLLHDYAEMRTM